MEKSTLQVSTGGKGEGKGKKKGKEVRWRRDLEQAHEDFGRGRTGKNIWEVQDGREVQEEKEVSRKRYIGMWNELRWRRGLEQAQEDFKMGMRNETFGKYRELKEVQEENEVRKCGARHKQKQTVVGRKIERGVKAHKG